MFTTFMPHLIVVLLQAGRQASKQTGNHIHSVSLFVFFFFFLWVLDGIEEKLCFTFCHKPEDLCCQHSFKVITLQDIEYHTKYTRAKYYKALTDWLTVAS